MIAATIAAVILLLLLAVPFAPCRLTARYGQKTSLYLWLLFYKVDLISENDDGLDIGDYSVKSLLRRREKKQKEKASVMPGKRQTQRSASETVDAVLQYLKILMHIARDLIGPSRTEIKRFDIRIATGDAATTAVQYGAVVSVANALLAHFDEVTKLHVARGADVRVYADFLGNESAADIKITVYFPFYRLISAIVRNAGADEFARLIK